MSRKNTPHTTRNPHSTPRYEPGSLDPKNFTNPTSNPNEFPPDLTPIQEILGRDPYAGENFVYVLMENAKKVKGYRHLRIEPIEYRNHFVLVLYENSEGSPHACGIGRVFIDPAILELPTPDETAA